LAPGGGMIAPFSTGVRGVLRAAAAARPYADTAP
jgi:hypothetical protein